jgi:ankyrin repeat protein
MADPLFDAIIANDLDAVVVLLRHGAEANGWDESRTVTPIITAVGFDNIEAVRILLAAGADPNVRDDEGDSPLRLCAQKRQLGMARLLLLCGATKAIDEAGGPGAMTALGYAAQALDVDMVRLLLAHGANPQARDVDNLTALDCLRFIDPPEEPAVEERMSEIRRLLGAAHPTALTSNHNGKEE